MIYQEATEEDQTIMHYLGGEPAYWPRRSFVSREVAVQVIKDFLETETPSEAVAWKPQVLLEDGTYGYGPLE